MTYIHVYIILRCMHDICEERAELSGKIEDLNITNQKRAILKSSNQ
jgi:hypothetical protein